MQYWEHVAEIPPDGDGTFLEGASPGAAFNVALAALDLAPCERIVGVAAALCWRNTSSAAGRAVLHVGTAEQATGNFSPSTTYDTVFVFARNSPATGKPWTWAEVNAARVGGVVYTGAGLRATQARLHVFLHTAPVQITRKELPMNFRALEPLIADDSDQPVEVPRGAMLVVHPLAANVEVRDVAEGTAKLTIPADAMVMLGPSYGQTVYLKAIVGTVIELAVT
ncbi:MAG: hypothetical protein KA383_13070 [Phycisphaerae bacterium]|nr:hypothetical protein [Phycisphaerae bacterium]